MNTEINDKLDLMIAYSAKECGSDDVEMFRSLDTTEVSLSKEFYIKKNRTISRYNIGGELIPNRLNHALQINASLVDLVDKDNGGNVHFPQGMEQNTGLGLHAIFSGDHQDGPI